MKLYWPSELTEMSGDMIMLYGDSGVGKSVTAIQTAPDPIIYIQAEGRDVTKMLTAAKRPGVKIKFGFYSTFDDLMQTVTNEAFFAGTRSLVIDSLTHIMAINLSDEILDESFDAMDKKKIEKELTMRVKLSQEGYGSLSGNTLRLTNALTRLSLLGITVICIARAESAPKFNRSLAAAPSFKGREYTKYFAGFFDFIGYVEDRVADGIVIYPPSVSFQGDGSFMCKWSGEQPPGGVYKRILNIEKILDASHGRNKKED